MKLSEMGVLLLTGGNNACAIGRIKICTSSASDESGDAVSKPQPLLHSICVGPKGPILAW